MKNLPVIWYKQKHNKQHAFFKNNFKMDPGQ